MIAKALSALMLALVPVSATPRMMLADSLELVNYPMVHRVDCLEGRGSAFRVGGVHWLSVAHVTALHACSIDNQPITVTEQDGKRDFARLDAGIMPANGFKINCGGFIPGHWYYAVGFPHGGAIQVALALYATYAKSSDGRRILLGDYTVIPGMSGGPIMDETGAVVGTVNAYIPGTPISLSRELKDTSVCGADIA
jgi:hypothetical protein